MWWAVGICRRRRSKLNERSIHQKVSSVVVEEVKTSLAKVTPKFVRKTFLEQKDTPLRRWENQILFTLYFRKSNEGSANLTFDEKI